MNDETLDLQQKIIDALQEDLGLLVTNFELTEYIRGDPTVGNSDPTGAEIAMTVYVSFDEDPGDNNPYRVK